jgi:hypothetical protein
MPSATSKPDRHGGRSPSRSDPVIPELALANEASADGADKQLLEPVRVEWMCVAISRVGCGARLEQAVGAWRAAVAEATAVDALTAAPNGNGASPEE